MQRVIKRDGREVEFDKSKIIKAISCANQETMKSKQIGPRKIKQLANIVEEKCLQYKRAIKVEDINDLIEDELISRNYNHLVRTFIQYRYNKELVRKANTTDDSILSLINLSNEELKQLLELCIDYHSELRELGPVGFYEEFKDTLDFDPMFVEEYGQYYEEDED